MRSWVPCFARSSALALLALALRASDVLGAAPPPPTAPEPSLLLRPARVFDATSEQAHEGWAVLVTGSRIAAVGPAATVTAPAGSRTIDLPEMTLLPGLIDAHSHVFLHPYNETLWNDQVLKEPLAYRTIAAAIHCERTLRAGFTTLRDLGTEGAGYADLSVKRAIDEGRIPGPRLLVATLAIVATASYGPGPLGFAPEFVPPKGAQEATGVAEIVRAVREQVGHGADCREGVRRLPPRAGRHGRSDLLARGAEGARRRGARRRPPGRRARVHARGHAARDARRRRHDRARLRRHGRGLPADGGEARRLLPHAHGGGGVLGVLPGLRAGNGAVHRRHEDGAERGAPRAEERRHRRLRQRRRCLRPRRQLPRGRVAREGRHDAGAGAARGDGRQRARHRPRRPRRSSRSRDCSPISSRCPATRRGTSEPSPTWSS